MLTPKELTTMNVFLEKTRQLQAVTKASAPAIEDDDLARLRRRYESLPAGPLKNQCFDAICELTLVRLNRTEVVSDHGQSGKVTPAVILPQVRFIPRSRRRSGLALKF